MTQQDPTEIMRGAYADTDAFWDGAGPDVDAVRDFTRVAIERAANVSEGVRRDADDPRLSPDVKPRLRREALEAARSEIDDQLRRALLAEKHAVAQAWQTLIPTRP